MAPMHPPFTRSVPLLTKDVSSMSEGIGRGVRRQRGQQDVGDLSGSSTWGSRLPRRRISRTANLSVGEIIALRPVAAVSAASRSCSGSREETFVPDGSARADRRADRIRGQRAACVARLNEPGPTPAGPWLDRFNRGKRIEYFVTSDTIFWEVCRRHVADDRRARARSRNTDL